MIEVNEMKLFKNEIKRRIKMRNEKKQKLGEIKVQSFVTTLNWEEQKAVKGGNSTEQAGTAVPVFC
jgi:hypothetical protein